MEKNAMDTFSSGASQVIGEMGPRNYPVVVVLPGLLLAFLLFFPSPLSAQETAQEEYVGGVEPCKLCHAQQVASFSTTVMGKIFLKNPRNDQEALGCEACHGPARAHVESGGALEDIRRFTKQANLPAQELNAPCLQCHEKGARLFWEGSTHQSRGLACVNCHQIMKPTIPGSRFQEPLSTNRQFVKETKMEVCFQCHPMRRAQLQRSSHMPFREGKVTCINCHNPHGSPNPKLLIESSVNETCYQCHAERRGPFLWEHPPVMENCANCHDPHGSKNPQLLKASPPRLCQQCHDVAQHNSQPQLATARFAFNRGCANCHSEIHGSNSPSGGWFHR